LYTSSIDSLLALQLSKLALSQRHTIEGMRCASLPYPWAQWAEAPLVSSINVG
jgi:hypothetical protein